MWMDFTSDGDFELLIYDPRYFYFTRVQVGTAEENGNRDINNSQGSLPMITIRNIRNESQTRMFIEAVKYNHMNRENTPCNSDDSYSFSACVRFDIST